MDYLSSLAARSRQETYSSDAYSNSSSTVLSLSPWPTLGAPLPAYTAVPAPSLNPPGEAPSPVHYSVTIIITTLVAILFLLVYSQLIMVICFGYKLLTYQTVLLFDILLWAALRLTLYSFYFYHCCDLVNRIMGTFTGWILISFPSALQYFSLALLVHYFGEVKYNIALCILFKTWLVSQAKLSRVCWRIFRHYQYQLWP